ncbi:Radial spoke head 14 [Blattella germanica]|nr:Radial spoke head 14 [Blattella germanica]
MFITITTEGRLKVLSQYLLERLIELCGHSENQELQICCLKILTNLAEGPMGRKSLLKKFEQDIINMPILKRPAHESIAHHRETLLTVMRWKP